MPANAIRAYPTLSCPLWLTLSRTLSPMCDKRVRVNTTPYKSQNHPQCLELYSLFLVLFSTLSNQFDIFISEAIFENTTGALVAVEGAVSDVWIRDDTKSSAASPPSFLYIVLAAICFVFHIFHTDKSFPIFR